MLLAILLIVVEFLITPKVVFAISPPTQVSPSNNSQVSSSKLTWETPSYLLYSNNPYRIQVDDNSDFSSVYRDYNTKNTYYTPVLTEGTWYWRIKAKDSNAAWSDWSGTWSFILSATSSSPTSVPAPTSTSSPSPSSASSSNSSSFTISNTPSQINSDQSFNVTVSLSSRDNPNTIFYLKGAFKKEGSANYFGLNKVGGDWIKNSSTYTNQYKIITDASGNWSGNLEVQPNADDSGFIGTDDYIFKVGKYNSTDTNPSVSWSNNEVSIKIMATNINTDQGSTGEETTKTTSQASNSKSPTPKSTSSEKSILTKKSTPKFNYQIASVAGTSASAIPTSNQVVKSQKQINLISWVGLTFIIVGLSSLGYILNKNGTIYNFFRKRN